MSQPEITTARQPIATTYDTNFCFPVRELESERVKLTPFIPDLHADLYFQGSIAHPDLHEFLSWETFTDTSDFVKKVIDGRVRPDGVALYAVIDKTRTSPSPSSSANFAGIIGYVNGSLVNLSIDIGYVIILPPFQRTHVATNAVGLLLQYALDLPPHGLGLRRVQWKANSKNTKSIGAVQKFGFKLEAILRWERIFVGSKTSASNGVKEREGDPRPGTIGMDLVVLALCWDDWESERARVLQAMDRRS
ncbi:acyl-CoA N-acyltransferase [Suillus clintonianus]|uniref:acyl-CoA N-acyltransferase n=1 Tax=Suillus clintonianus TaxID=1904413 RepID=UPI001B8729EF|nr:acyl-CoA N-acyltransferase [Suillus clintonianus]KAG2119297.1 acyl-CoA N-acyltransferase [Suillus clintonianus]